MIEYKIIKCVTVEKFEQELNKLAKKNWIFQEFIPNTTGITVLLSRKIDYRL